MSLVFLIGMPGCGKTHHGELLAKGLDYKFIDADSLIAQQESRSIAEIFETKGEGYFREIEQKTLNNVISNSKNSIIACGGGLPCFDGNLDTMLQSGIVVYLQCDLETLTHRIRKQNNRPLLQMNVDLQNQLSEMYELRMPFYMGANYILTQEEITIEKFKEILRDV